jgi:hypothetical protein
MLNKLVVEQNIQNEKQGVHCLVIVEQQKKI